LRSLEYHNRNETDLLRFPLHSRLRGRAEPGRGQNPAGENRANGLTSGKEILVSELPGKGTLPDTALWDAYRRAAYVARTGDSEIRIHPGQRTPDLDTLLDQRRADQWAYITAYNPESRLLSEEENVRRQQALAQAVQDLGLTFFEGESVLDAAAWPPEPSLLILGISPDEARALGREFGQLAIVVGRRDHPARLVACDERAQD
jgi:hypothetical protein